MNWLPNVGDYYVCYKDYNCWFANIKVNDIVIVLDMIHESEEIHVQVENLSDNKVSLIDTFVMDEHFRELNEDEYNIKDILE